MSEASLEKKIFSKPQIFEIRTAVRGYEFDLPQIKKAYQELQTLNDGEGKRILSLLSKGEDQTQEELEQYKREMAAIAFRVTVSIVGGDDGTIRHGEDASIFGAADLPEPINTIYMTNETAFGREAGGNLPPNRFNIWIHFTKPPLVDPNPLVSDPTQNSSEFTLRSDDLTYYSAAQRIISERLMKRRTWYSYIHNKFSFDVGLWAFFLPLILYHLSAKIPIWIPSPYITLPQVAAFTFLLGACQIVYRTLFGYMKWALPVNVLKENVDRSAIHRIFFGLIIIGVLGNGAYTIFGLAYTMFFSP